MATSPAKQKKPVLQRRPGRPPKEDVAGLRELYLQAALDTFLQHGYERSSLDQIAKTAGAGKMTLYRQFGSKEELFRLTAHHAMTKVRQLLQFTVADEGEPEKVIPEMIMRLHRGLTDPEYLGILRLVIAENSRFPELGETLLKDDRYLLEPVVTYLEQAVKAGKLVIDDPYAATMQLAALAIGGTRFLIKPPPRDVKRQEQWVAAISHFVLRSWRP